jgi:hypothetical protein
MLKLIAFVGVLAIWAQTCTQTVEHGNNADESAIAKVDTTVVASVNFDADIKPIFQAHCQPCHFTGGKMYERMPFDQPKTIRDHSEGIFRRIKDPEEVKKLTAFLEQSSP